jgi:hypothetical protein
MLFCMGARARVVDEIVDSNTLFPHLMMAMSSHFAYVDSNRQLLSNCCTCPNLFVFRFLFAFDQGRRLGGATCATAPGRPFSEAAKVWSVH